MKVISFKNLPVRLPVNGTIIAWLLFDRLELSGWLLGVLWTLIALVWTACIYQAATQKQTDIFDKP